MGDAVGALNPLPLFKSAIGSGYVQCKKVTLPVGDLKGQVQSGFDPSNVWITDPYKVVNGAPSQTRWVMDKYITQEEYDAAPKTEQPGVLPNTEGFSGDSGNTIAAGILFAALFLGVAAWAVRK